MTAGIWRPARLESWSGARITDVHWGPLNGPDGGVPDLDGDPARIIADVEIEADRGGTYVVEVASDEPGVASAPVEVDLEPGSSRIEVPVEIEGPELWWPRGMGEPRLYRARVRLRAGEAASGAPLLDETSTRFGLRTVELITETDSIGESFFFRINGRPMFARGANVVPLDHFTPRVDPDRYRALFAAAAHAHMNMFRVWGGGIYETDLFYDLADEHGILIWQDFMFANGLYPWDDSFLESVRAEARHQVLRLRNHPSLALWCGNNEITEGWENWGWQTAHGYSAADSSEAWNGYRDLFHGVLPEVLAELDPHRPYWPSSPSIGWGHPESLVRGDSHYWGVWWGLEPFETYGEKVPRFASEFGFQGYPDPATLEAVVGEDDRWLGSPVMRAHQKHPTGVETLRVYLERELGVIGTARLLERAGWSGRGSTDEDGVRDFAFVTQLLQARGMEVALRAHRMSPSTGGTLYWQLNDTWPVASWSSLDHALRTKGLHYAARSAFAPITLGWSTEGGEVLSASDLESSLRGRVEYAYASPGEAVEGGVVEGAVPPGRGRVLARLPLRDLRPGTLVGVRFVPLTPAGGVPSGEREPLTRLTRVVGRWSDLDPHPEGSGITFSLGDWSGDSLAVTVRAARATVGVHLETDGRSLLSDDFFDLLPGEERHLWLVPYDGPGGGRPRIEVWTLNEALSRLR